MRLPNFPGRLVGLTVLGGLILAACGAQATEAPSAAEPAAEEVAAAPEE